MSYSWAHFRIKRFLGLDLITNVLDVRDGKSLDLQNVFQNTRGTVQKRPGSEIMFDQDEAGVLQVDEIGKAKLNGTVYYFRFSGGKFFHANTLTGMLTTLAPSPAISTVNPIYWAVIQDKLFFVDGTNVLRFFNGTAVLESSIYERPSTAPTTASGGTGFDYVYTVDNGLGESPSVSNPLVNKGSAATITIQGNFGPDTLVAGDVVKIYSRATTVAAASKLVAEYIWSASDVSAGFANIPTSAITDAAPQLYTELGLVPNKSAPTGLTGITVHYGRLVGWMGSSVHNSKVTNPHSWPDDSAAREAFVYSIWDGDGETIKRCLSYRESLYVMKPGNVAVFGGIGPDDTGNNAYSFRRLETQGDGCIAGKSAVVIGADNDTFLVWLSRNGFRASNGNFTWNIGEEIERSVQGTTDSILELSHGFHDQKNGLYVCFFGGAVSKVAWILDVRKDANDLVGWWKWAGMDASCSFYDDNQWILGTLTGTCLSERGNGTSSDFSDVRQEYILPGAVDTGADSLTVALSYQTGDMVKVRSTGTVPGGLTANVDYYAIRISATVIKLATSAVNAQAGTFIDLTTQGTGVLSLVGKKAIDAFYTTNWINFGSATKVKKLGKPGFVFNAQAEALTLTIEAAFDWKNQFFFAKTVNIASIDTWGSQAWGDFVWGQGGNATPKNTGLPRRKIRSVRYKFSNATVDQDFNLQGFEQDYAMLRNRGNFA